MVAVLDFQSVSVVRSGQPILNRIDWHVEDDERWVILGPNGAGKSTLLALAAAQMHPSSGNVQILEETLGRTDVFDLRPRIGLASSAVARRIPAGETVKNVVLTAAYGVTGRWREQYDDLDEDQADYVLHLWQLTDLADRRFGTLSDGEQKRVQIARAVMTDPEILLMDEPSASLDLGARERLLASLTNYLASEGSPAIIMVTHHVEEIPVGITHALLLRDGEIVGAGAIDEVVTGEKLSDTFGLPLQVTREDGRFTARAK